MLVPWCSIEVSHIALTPAAVTNNCHAHKKKGAALECPSLSTAAAVTLSPAFVMMGLLLLQLVLFFSLFIYLFIFACTVLALVPCLVVPFVLHPPLFRGLLHPLEVCNGCNRCVYQGPSMTIYTHTHTHTHTLV